MAGTDTTTAAVAIQEYYVGSFTDAVYRNGAIYDIFGEPADYQGTDSSYRFGVKSAANGSVEVYTEHQVQPAPGYQATVEAAIAPLYVRGMIQISGHMRDLVRRGGNIDVLDMEFSGLQGDIRDLVTTSLIGSTYGLEASVSATTTYAGITRGAATYWESYVTTVSGAQNFGSMVDTQEGMEAADHGGRLSVVLMPPNQATNYYNLTGQPGMKTVPANDAAAGLSNIFFNGVPIVRINDMTSTTVLFLDTRPGKWEFVAYRMMEVRGPIFSADDDLYQVSTAVVLANRNPTKDASEVSVTA